MNPQVRVLSEITRAPSWPDRWLTLKEIHDELDDRRAWGRLGLAGWSAEGRLDWLRRAVRPGEDGGRVTWLNVGARYKHFEAVARNRRDLNDYLDWRREVREARFRRAEQLLNGSPGGPVVLHALAPDECAERGEALAVEVIGLLPDEAVAARVARIWQGYEANRPRPAVARLKVCRLVFALALVYLEALRDHGVVLGHDAPEPLRRLERAVTRADRWVTSLFAAPAAEVPEREAA